MASRPRHARPAAPRLLRAGVTLSAAAGVALSAAGAAQAAIVDDPVGSVGHAVAPFTNLQLHPLAKTGVDPLDNGVGTQIADFQPITTTALTEPLSSGSNLSDLVGRATDLPGR
ncbi:hypothetical protein H3146_09355 [Streptomyces sp. OF3]|uniref:Secreted protein n=1 Tax=Streptomyces alkaliterrae TaxID=2213162 RepID=A0A7W3WJQ8_9ACTN|nr:hypothetical protein [Streptomyces alkaliterrae]MBB1253574.1 hypothetical protein [Streptomyces alkaliterrae]